MKGGVIAIAGLVALGAVMLQRRKKSEGAEGEGGAGGVLPGVKVPTGEPVGDAETPDGEQQPERPMPSVEDFEDGLAAIMMQDGSPAVARLVEKMYRLETAHMTSGGYRATYTPGMKCGWKNGQQVLEFPFGWAKRGTVASDYLPPVKMKDNLEGAYSWWVVFRELPVAMQYVAQVLRDRGMNPGAWNSTNPDKQAAYNAKLSNIPTPLADKVWAEIQASKDATKVHGGNSGNSTGVTASTNNPHVK